MNEAKLQPACVHLDEDGEDGVGDDGDGRLHDVREERREREAVGQVAAPAVAVDLSK